MKKLLRNEKNVYGDTLVEVNNNGEVIITTVEGLDEYFGYDEELVNRAEKGLIKGLEIYVK